MTTAKQGGQHPHARQTTNKHPDAAEALGARRRPLGRLGSMVVTFGVLLSTACGAGSGSSPEQGTGGSGSASGGSVATSGGSGGGTSVALSAGSIASPSSIGGLAPDAGRHFLTIEATLSDVSAPEAVPVGFAYYTLATVKGLVIMPASASDVVSMPCASDTSVSVGAEYSCTIAFAVPTGDSPARLSYDDLRGDTATVPVSYTVPPPPVSAACNTFASYKFTDIEACETCIGECSQLANTLANQQVDGTTCPSAATACATCPPFITSPGYCECHDACLGGCQPAFDAELECDVAHCAASCM